MYQKFRKILYRIMESNTVQYGIIVCFAFFSALSFEIFVYANDFAPTGINGLATMIQYMFNISVGYISLLINIPMLIVAFFVINRRYAVRNIVFISVFSLCSVFLRQVDLSAIRFVADDVGGSILASIAGGFFYGIIYSTVVRLGASTGGTDIMASFINKRWPEFDTVWVIFVLNAVVAVLSFFVYGYDYTAVILCLINNYVCSRVSDVLLKGPRSAAKFEVITTHPEELSRELLQNLHHGCTIVPVKGAYTGTERSMLLCVVNRRQVVDFEKIIRKYDDTFAVVSTVNGTVGSFQKVK